MGGTSRSLSVTIFARRSPDHGAKRWRFRLGLRPCRRTITVIDVDDLVLDLNRPQATAQAANNPMTDVAPRDADPIGLLQVRRGRDEHGVVLELRGELDLGSAPELQRQLAEAEAEKPARLLIDLGSLSFMDSTGLALMLRAQQTAQDNGHQLCLRSGSPQVQRLFELTGAVDRFTFED
jgi:anti-sigma B factor antagonist